MDKFLTYTGEQPIWLDDINYMNRAMSDTLTRIVQSLTQFQQTEYILQGCDVTLSSTELSWTDGIVMLDGEILPVRAGKIPSQQSEEYYHFKIVEEYDPAGKRMFRDGTTRECYQIRYATIVYNGQVEYSVIEMLRLEDELTSLYNAEKSKLLYSTNNGYAKLINSAGGVYISGTFRVEPAFGITTDVITTAISIGADVLGNSNLTAGIKTSVMYFRNLTGSGGQICAVIATITYSDNQYKVALSFDKKYSFSMGEGNFYIRLN